MSALGKWWLRPRGAWLDVLPVALYLAVLFWFGLTPLQSLPGPEFHWADKVWHAAAFGGLAALLARSGLQLGRRGEGAARFGALGSTLLGAALEVLQAFTRYRSADWADFVADALGAALAYAALRGRRAHDAAEAGE
ncbi:MAG: VanZ like family [Polyangiaceae bacterium]|jgi:VanZ family protein|nr:VanZ like family [Polyangiaceae bacterium]